MINTQNEHTCLCSIIDQLQQIIQQNTEIIELLKVQKTYTSTYTPAVVCDVCNGTGFIEVYDRNSTAGKRTELCPKCGQLLIYDKGR
jgi:RecJ-like exonuclease